MNGIRAKDQTAIEEAKRKYDAAKQTGDRAGMDAAHREAEAVRAQYGFSGGEDGSQRIALAGADKLDSLIDEARAQTDALQPGDAPQAGETQYQTTLDKSYTTPADQLKTGEFLPIKRLNGQQGTILQEANGQSWMYDGQGSGQNITGMSAEAVEALRRQVTSNNLELTGRINQVGEDGRAPGWLDVGDQVVTAGGTYVITGHKPGGGYYSELKDAGQTTGNYAGRYNTGTYGAMIGRRNENPDGFSGNRENGENNVFGGYRRSVKDGAMQFETQYRGYDGERLTNGVIRDGKAYTQDGAGRLEPMDPGSSVVDATGREWVIAADGEPIDVTGMSDERKRGLMRQEAKNGGTVAKREREREEDAAYQLEKRIQEEMQKYAPQMAREQQALAETNRDLYIQYREGQESLGEALADRGLSATGTAEGARADLTADWIAAYMQNQRARQQAEEEIRLQAADAARREMMEEQQRMQIKQQQAESARLQEALQRAETLAQYGDFSGYDALGYTPDQIRGMTDRYAQGLQGTGYEGLSPYAKTLLNIYKENPGYDLQGSLKQAREQNLIAEQDYTAALLAAGIF